MTPLALCLTLFLAVLLQEEAAPIAGALAAHHDHLDPWWVGLSCGLGAWTGDIVLYLVGRRGSRLFGRPGFAKARGFVVRHPRGAPLAVRFAYGLRFTLPLACGAARLPFAPYALWVGVSTALWSGLFTTVGWVAGELALRLFHDLEHYELPFIALAMVAWLAILVWGRGRGSAAKPDGPAVANA